MAQYPASSNLNWTDSTVPGQGDELVDQQDVNFAAHVNEIRDEVKAIAGELGTNPRGAQSTVKARLDNIESTKSSTTHTHDSAYVAKATLIAKGNILTATGAGVPAVLAPGGNGTVVMFDSAQPTGIKAKSLDHGDDIGGLGDDDHPHYYNAARHATADHSGIPGVPPYPFVGMVVDSARPDIPALWLECNGQAVSRTTYADLFAAISTTYGTGDGSTTFNLPNSKGRTRVGFDSAQVAYDTLGKTGGAETVSLTVAQLPGHTHTGPNHNHSGPNHSHSGPSHSHGAGSYSAAGDSHDHSLRMHSQPDFEVTHAHDGGTGRVPSQGNYNLASSQVDTRAPIDHESHGHDVTGTSSSSGTGQTGNAGTGNTGNAGTGNTGSTGSGSAHENMPPFVVFKSLIFAGA